MAIATDLLKRKSTHFVLWAPGGLSSPPTLVIGQFQPGNPPTLNGERILPMVAAAGVTGLWEIAAANCGLRSGEVYHYWFDVVDTNPDRNPPQHIRCSDPAALMVDWRLLAPALPAPYTDDDREPAAVIKFKNGKVVVCDPGGEEPDFTNDSSPAQLVSNNALVIYELPTAWTRVGEGILERGVGTFRDVTALVAKEVGGANFSDLDVTQPGRSYLTELGVNALELLPPANSFFKREWGYDTSHYLAPDFELGFPDGNSSPTPNSDLATLVNSCHQNGIRFFIDVVMAFSKNEPYQHINFPVFCIDDPKADPSDPDAHNSRGNTDNNFRDGFGSTLWRYAKFVNAYDPMAGTDALVVPARQHMFSYLTRWMRDFRVDGVRIDSVENIANWDFLRDFKDLAHNLWLERWLGFGLAAGPTADAKFIVVGEELSLPMDLLRQGRLDGLWNEEFQKLVRAVVLGQNSDDEPTFEWTVRKAIDCRILGFADGTQAINYVTKHDVEGYRHERLYNMLLEAGLDQDAIEKRVKLAFVCLLTAVGIPMFLAGEEFADQHDRFDANGNVTQNGGKQVDPVNYSRLQEPMRQRVFRYVSELVHFRTTQPALGVNDTQFIHIDFSEGKRVLAWVRGGAGMDPVVVLANFSDFGTANPQDPNSEYRVSNWPATPANRQWREITQNRAVPVNFVAREPIYPWEAKVYTLA